MDVTKISTVQLYPGHAKPTVTSPKPWDVIIGSNTTSIVWQPHRFSDPASSPSKGLKGYAVRVVPLAAASSTAECPASSVFCRPTSDPVLVGESSSAIAWDSLFGVTLTVTTPIL